jgi:ABC-type dipeptide/oligopeptide/nickel transport system ATPase subunit
MRFQLELQDVQHIRRLELALNLNQHKLTCIVGRNGVGKTTLVRALRNLARADTFSFTAARNIFEATSFITYQLDEEAVTFNFDPKVKSLNCRQTIPPSMKAVCSAELPMPYGERFNYFKSASDADTDIRRQIILEEFKRPDELIQFLSDIYGPNRFDSLIEVEAAERRYYCLLREGSRYVREDYFSSGEHFLINLYRTIKGAARLIVVDEIDLSLDAVAQVQLVKKLRAFCQQYGCNVLFTTHSLAMIRTLDASELLYMETEDGVARFSPASYSYVKSMMFGFTGWDRYILTEDVVLANFIEYLIQHHCQPSFFRYKIIHIGGAGQVVDLLRRNAAQEFLAPARQVIAVLDGDQAGTRNARRDQVHCVPMQSVEKALCSHYDEAGFRLRQPTAETMADSKKLFEALKREGAMTEGALFAFLCSRYQAELGSMIATLNELLAYEPAAPH